MSSHVTQEKEEGRRLHSGFDNTTKIVLFMLSHFQLQLNKLNVDFDITFNNLNKHVSL